LSFVIYNLIERFHRMLKKSIAAATWAVLAFDNAQN
jgi:hypothetical protein